MKKNLVTIAAFIAGLFLTTATLAQDSLAGAWQTTEVMISGGDNEGTYTDNLALIMFSEGHYSAFSNFGDRPDLSEDDGEGPLSDDLALASFQTFRANAGTYEVSGSKLMLHFMLARSPRAVGITAESEYRIEGDKLITTATNDQGVVTRTTYMRVD